MAKSAEAFRTISEVAEWLDTPAHVLRFWESKFPQVKPVKRAGGRRYYRPSDMELLGGIKQLLHNDGMTIKGVQKLLREHGVKHVAGFSQGLNLAEDAEDTLSAGFIEAEPEAEQKGRLLSFPSSDAAQGDAPKETSAPVAKAAPPESPPEAPADAGGPDSVAPPPAPLAPPETPLQPEKRGDRPFEETDDLPAFLRKDSPAEDTPATGPAAETAAAGGAPEPSAAPTETDPEATRAPEPQPQPQVAKARQVATPDDPGDDMPAAPGLLTRLAHVRGPIPPATAAELAALLSRLTTLRSQMADGRKE